MNFLLLTVRPENLKISAVYKGQMRDVVLTKTGNYPSCGSSRGSSHETHQGVATFVLQSLMNVNQNSVHLIIEKSTPTVTQLKHGTWLVYFHEIRGEVDFKCCYYNFKIGMGSNETLSLQVMKTDGGK
jgi:hypothetical protein